MTAQKELPTKLTGLINRPVFTRRGHQDASWLIQGSMSRSISPVLKPASNVAAHTSSR
jgi:hypothetical protein